MIYSVSMHNCRWLSNTTGYQCQHQMSAHIIHANNEYEAKGEALTKNQEDFPSDQGWSLIKVLVLEMPIMEDE